MIVMPNRTSREPIDVTVVFLDGTFSSTAIGPMEVFRHAGSLWNILTGQPQVPRFRVTTVSADGRPVRCDGRIQIKPDAVSYTHLRAHETPEHLVCRLLL